MSQPLPRAACRCSVSARPRAGAPSRRLDPPRSATGRYQFWAYLDYLLFVAYSFWLPQIFHNARTNSGSTALSSSYIFSISASRLALPLYMWLYPDNFVAYVSARTVACWRRLPSL